MPRAFYPRMSPFCLAVLQGVVWRFRVLLKMGLLIHKLPEIRLACSNILHSSIVLAKRI